MVYQLEMCPKTGRLHYQGYVVFKRSQRFNWVRNFFERYTGQSDIHVEQCGGTHDQNVAYCTKDESRVDGPWEFGDRQVVGSGRRTDLHDVQALLDQGANLREVATKHFSSWVKYRQAFADYAVMKKTAESKPKYEMDKFNMMPLDLTLPVWLYGPTNCGKTSFAMAHFKNPLMVQHLEDLKAFDAKLHDGIVFDDMSFTHVPFQQVLRLFESEYDSTIHCRYMNAVIPKGTKRIFTHNTPDAWVPKDLMEGQYEALNRRIKLVCIPEDIRETVDEQVNNNNNVDLS